MSQFETAEYISFRKKNVENTSFPSLLDRYKGNMKNIIRKLLQKVSVSKSKTINQSRYLNTIVLTISLNLDFASILNSEEKITFLPKAYLCDTDNHIRKEMR